MNLFIRIVLVWVKSFFSPAIGILEPCISRFRVWFTDQDAFRHMTNSRYFSLTDVCIIDFMLRSGAWRGLSKKGWMPVIVYEDMIILRMLRFPQKFTVETTLLGWDDKYAILTHLFRRGGEPTAEGYTVARFVDTKGKRIPTGEVLALLGETGQSPPLPAQAQEVLARAKSGYDLAAQQLGQRVRAEAAE